MAHEGAIDGAVNGWESEYAGGFDGVRIGDSERGGGGGDRSWSEARAGDGGNFRGRAGDFAGSHAQLRSAVDGAAADRGFGRGGYAANEAVARPAHAGDRLPGCV